MMVLGRTKHNLKLIKKLVFVLILFALFFGFSKTAYALTEATFLPSSYNLGAGQSFNYKLRELDPISFRKATVAEYNSALPNLSSADIVSTADSDYPIYLWLDANDTALYYSEADKIYANTNSERMFYEVKHLVDADVTGFDTSRVTNMSQMFFNSDALISLDLSSWDTSNVTDMGGMFEQSNGLVSIDFTGWDVRNVESFSRMFCDCSVTLLDLSGFVTSSATRMEQMFANAGNLASLNISNFDTSNITNMWSMFEGIQVEELDVTSFDVSKVTDMARMFSGCTKLRTLDLSSFEPKSVVYMSQMFNYCLKLTTIYVDPVKWGTPRPRYSDQMFSTDYRIMGQNGTTYVGADDGTFNLSRARVDDPENDKPGYLTDVALKGQLYHSITYPDGRVFIVEHNAGLDLEPNETTNGTYQSGEITFIYHNGVTEPTTTSQTVTMVGDGYTADGIHYYDNGISWNNSFWVRATKDITLEYAYKPEVLPGQDFPIATKEGKIFTGWYTEEDGGTKVTSYSETEPLTLHAHYDNRTSFLKEGYNISSKIGDITNYSDSLNTFRKATESEYNNIKDSLTEDNIVSTEDSHFPTYMWYDGENVLYYSEADYIYINDYAGDMFSSTSFVSIDLSGLYTNNVNYMARMFAYNERLQEVYFGDNFDTSNVTDMSYMFYDCSSLNNIDFYNIDMSSVTTTSEMFYNCSSLTYIDFKRKPLRSLEYAYEMFYGCSSLTYLDLTMFDNSNLYDYGYMFNNMPNLKTIYVSDLWSEDNYYYEQYNVFNYSTKLVGGAGTTYDENHDTSEYARVDDPDNDKPGYFTYREFRPMIYHPYNNWDVDYGSSYTFEDNYQRDNTHVATVTLNKNYDGSEDDYAYVDIQFILTKWKVEKNEYDFGDTIIVDQDIYLDPIGVETIIGADLQAPRRLDYKFLGWYTDPENGELVESYNGEEDITLYAHWTEAVTSTLVRGYDFDSFVRDKDFDTFRKATLEEYNNVSSTLTDDNIISTDDSDVPTYYWNQDGDFVYYSEADIIYLNESCWQMFTHSRFRAIDLSGLDSTKVTDTREMFAYNNYLTSINFTNFDTSNVTQATYMFDQLSAIRELDLSNFNTSKVESAQGMFSGLDSIEELDLSSFDMSSATDLYCMFSSMPNLTTIYVSDKWDVSHYGENPYNSELFYFVLNLTGYYGTVYSGDHAKWDYAHIDGGVENPGYLTHVSNKGETHTVTYPDETVEIKKHNAIITLGDNNTTSDQVDDLATITFKLHNGEDDIIKHVQNVYYANGFLVNGISYSNGDNVRVNEDKVIDYNYTGYPTSPEFPENPTDDRRLFLGWYTEEEDGDEVDYYDGEDDITLHAHWSEELLKLTVDGKTTLVEPGYVYTIPHGIPVENSDYITIYLEDSYNQDYKEVKISYGNAVNYQIIKGTKYYPGDTYVVNEDTNVTSNKSSDKTAVMDPYVEEPTYHDENGDYVFKGWIMAYWDYVDPIDVNIDIYSLTPDDVLFDNQTFLADFGQINEEEQVRLTIIDDYRKNNYTYIVPKGLEITVTDIDTDLHNSRRMYIGNNINDDYVEYNYEIDALISHYLINDEEVPNEEDITRTINEDTTIEVVRVLTENEYCNDHETCPSIIYTEPYSRVSFDGVDNYIYTGIYGDSDGNGRMLTLSNFKPTGDPNGSLEGTVYMHFIDGTNNIILTVDEDVSIIPKGMGVIPEAKEKADDVIPITLVYQDNETPNGVANMTYKHEFEGYKKQNYWRVYNPGEEYDYEEDTYFYSSYNNEWIYDELPYIDDDHFKGWWTEPEGGDRVDELEYMRWYYEDYGYDTLYAHWGEPTVEICHGKGDCEEIVKGTTVTLEQPEPTVVTAHFTLDYNTEEPGYDPKNVTTTRTETVEYFMINDERYDFGETYTFNENVDMYGVTTTVYTSDFEGYYSDNWDYGLNINGYELRGWCATTDGRYCRHYDEGDDIVQPDGLTLYATYYQSEGDTVRVTVDWDTTYDWPKGESILIPDDIVENIEFAEPQSYSREIDFDLNDESGETLSGSIAVNEVFSHFRVGNDDIKKYQQHDLYTFYRDIHIQSQFVDEYGEIDFPEMNEPTFKGWYTKPEGGRRIKNTEDFVKYMDLYNSFTLYAHYGEISEELESVLYVVANKTNEDQSVTRFIVGADAGTLISEFKENMDNPNEYIKIYDLDNNEVSDDDIIKTGLIIKLVIDGNIYDEATMVVRGDIDGDGIVNITDLLQVKNHIQELTLIEDPIRFIAANVVTDDILNVSDQLKLSNYLNENIDTLNE